MPSRPLSPVVVNCRFLTRPVTGVERFAEELTTRLVELRDDILLVAPAGELRKNEIGGQPVHRVGRLRGHLWEQSELPLFAHRHGRALMLNLANTGPAFSHEQIVAIHDINHRRNPASFSWRFRTLYRALTPLLVRNAAAVVTVSQFSKQEIATYYGRADGVVVIPNAVGEWVHVPGRKPAGAADDEFFLLVGSPSAHKNVDVAIAGFQRYRAAGGRAAPDTGRRGARFTRSHDHRGCRMASGALAACRMRSSPGYTNIARRFCFRRPTRVSASRRLRLKPSARPCWRRISRLSAKR